MLRAVACFAIFFGPSVDQRLHCRFLSRRFFEAFELWAPLLLIVLCKQGFQLNDAMAKKGPCIVSRLTKKKFTGRVDMTTFTLRVHSALVVGDLVRDSEARLVGFVEVALGVLPSQRENF